MQLPSSIHRLSVHHRPPSCPLSTPVQMPEAYSGGGGGGFEPIPEETAAEVAALSVAAPPMLPASHDSGREGEGLAVAEEEDDDEEDAEGLAEELASLALDGGTVTVIVE